MAEEATICTLSMHLSWEISVANDLMTQKNAVFSIPDENNQNEKWDGNEVAFLENIFTRGDSATCYLWDCPKTKFQHST